jgi:3-hydroxyisobutyrate dehydrogenase-like beta-hydroxyacid dehydrogenase
MGTAAAERLLDAGVELFVFNRTGGRDAALIERGATRLASAAEALGVADLCLLTLADDGAVEAVAGGDQGVLAGARPGTTLVEMSTISVAASERIAEQAEAQGVGYLRAPFSGNPSAVRSGTAVIFVSGDADLAERCDSVLRAIAPTVRYVGEGEQARVLKLVLQILIGGIVELLAEAVVLGEAAGLERAQLLEVVNASVTGSTLTRYKSEPLLQDDFSPTFTTAMMRKDIDLVLELARALEVELPLTGELRSLLDAASANGHAEEDFMSLVLELKERSSGAQTMRNR